MAVSGLLKWGRKLAKFSELLTSDIEVKCYKAFDSNLGYIQGFFFETGLPGWLVN